MCLRADVISTSGKSKDEMELKQIFSTLLKWWWLIVISVVVAGVSSYLGTRGMPKTYTAHTTLMVGQALQSLNPSTSDLYTGQTFAQFYASLVPQELVLKATIDALGLPWDWAVLKGMVYARAVPNSQLLEIAVQDTDPQRAQVLANEIAHQLILQSPTGSDAQKESDQQFIQSEMDEIKANISKAREEIRQLDDVIAKATSARQIQDARSRQAALETQIASWQSTYASLGLSLQRGAPNSLTVIERAKTPNAPIGPRTGYNVMLAMAIGLALSSSAAFLLDYLDDTLKSSDDVQQALDLKTLGNIARIEGKDYPSRLVVANYPRSPVAEAYRMLRTNLQHNAGERTLRTLMVTSANPLEGKSVTVANLAAAIAQSGLRVILIDADMRRPTQHQIFQLENEVGLSTVLHRGDVSVADVLQTVSVPNLSVVTSGPMSYSPSELLGSKRMGDLIELLEQYADILLFDTPPVMAVSDAAILASRLDGILLVIDAGHTRRGAAQRSKEALIAVGGHLLGVALNRMSQTRAGYYYYYYTSEDGTRERRHSRRNQLARLFGRNGHPADEIEVASAPSQETTETWDTTTAEANYPQDRAVQER